MKFARTKISSNDDRPIRVRYFGVFAQKLSTTKYAISKNKVTGMCNDNMHKLKKHYKTDDEIMIRNTLQELLDAKNYKEIALVYHYMGTTRYGI